MISKPVLSASVVAASAMLFWGTGLHPLWWLTWLAPLPVLLIAPRVGRWGAFAAGALCWFLGSLNMWYYLLTNFAPLPLVLLFSAIPACLFGLDVLLYRSFLLRGGPGRAAFAFAAFWVALEYVNNVASPNGTFPNMGYSQMDFLPVLQLTSLVGIWGISFCLLLFPAAIAAVLSPQATRLAKQRLAIAAGAFFVAVLGFGVWRLVSAPPPRHSVTAGLMATGVDTPFPQNDATRSG